MPQSTSTRGAAVETDHKGPSYRPSEEATPVPSLETDHKRAHDPALAYPHYSRPQEDATVATLVPSHHSFAFLQEHPLHSQWVAAFDGVHPLADVGCGAGVHTLRALRAGPDVRVVAIDLGQENVEHTVRKAGEAGVQERLVARVGRAPDALNFAPNSLSAVLIADCLHFLSPAEIEATLRAVYEALVPGGKLLASFVSSEGGSFEITKEHNPHPRTRLGYEGTMDSILDTVEIALSIYRTGVAPPADLARTTKREFLDASCRFHVLDPMAVVELGKEVGFKSGSAELVPFAYPLFLLNGRDRGLVVLQK